MLYIYSLVAAAILVLLIWAAFDIYNFYLDKKNNVEPEAKERFRVQVELDDGVWAQGFGPNVSAAKWQAEALLGQLNCKRWERVSVERLLV